ncbi:hypothetical protein K5I29_09400 [Flavobacterium agricola]|uniref:DUF1508 domain-containing protein n=1 Tax=Flavobacterium agricola TaxID=2870839 RepID=A0ABY6M0L4_9FLAO|nr:hypothetical protein [Flavobacterium agricola]UYW00733.1 hypothetical protein K5I29_09400 [Flavobacterium agricola]
MGTFAISLKDNGSYKFTYNNRRGKTVVTSIPQESIEACQNTIDILKAELPQLNFTKFKTAAGKFYFKISLRDETLCTSRKFTTVLRVEKAISEIKTYMTEAEVLDFTTYVFPEINFDSDDEDEE